jgi:uncharacterized protein
MRIARDGFTLAGNLLLPPEGATSAVVMLGGSGDADRLNGGYFLPIRSHLVEHGVAVLSCDKRGVGASGGDWRAASMSDLGDDALAILGHLRATVGPGMSIGLYGHSEGSWVALIAAARAPHAVDWIVTTSCPGMSPGLQDRHALAEAFADSPDRERILAAYDRLLAANDAASGLRVLSNTPALRSAVGDLSEAEWKFIKRKKNYEPLTDVRSLHCPWLSLYGAADRLVPVAESVAAFRDYATIHVFPAADHRIQVDGDLAPGLLELITTWLGSPS